MGKTHKKNDLLEKKNSFSVYFDDIISIFSPRSKEIIRFRFGVNEKAQPKTLQEIGKKYHITRERVRQIIREICRKINQTQAEKLKIAQNKILFTLEKNNGIMRKNVFMEKIGAYGREKGMVEFFLKCSNQIVFWENTEMKESVSLVDFKLEEWKEVNRIAKLVLEKENQLLNRKLFFEKISEKLKEDKIVVENLNEDKVFNFLDISTDIQKNVFGEWGLKNWKEINPRGVREMAYLVAKKEKKPLHFKEIATLIDQYGLNKKKKTHFQTVHNELIRDRRFVLAGRGIYALEEWGYKRGSVKDVLEEIIKESKTPLSKEEIITRALKVKRVKKSTIIINLNNFFKKIDGEKYILKK